MLTAADYVGSDACGDCHAKELAAWRKDWHARALSPARRPLVAGTFPASFHGASSQAEMRRGESWLAYLRKPMRAGVLNPRLRH